MRQIVTESEDGRSVSIDAKRIPDGSSVGYWLSGDRYICRRNGDSLDFYIVPRKVGRRPYAYIAAGVVLFAIAVLLVVLR